MKNPEVERVAETHYYIRPTLKIALKQHVLAEDGQQIFPNCSTYWDVFTHRFSDRFFDMGTLIRAAASVETGLRDYYMLKKGYTNLTQLRQDPGYKKNIFQRIMPWHDPDGAVELLRSDRYIEFDLNTIDEFPLLQELMHHRHLYAHNLGIIDDDYIKNLKKLTGIDIMVHPAINDVYPSEDVFWFEPLTRLNVFIEAVRRFFRKLP